MVDLRTEAPAVALDERHTLDADDIRALLAPRPSVDVAIVTYNSRLDLERCFASVERAARGLDARILIVDNDSSDGSLEYALTRRSGHVEGISMGYNAGYAKAVNAAAACSEAEYLIVLNPDVQVPGPDALARLIDHLQEHPEAAAVAPGLLDPDGGVQASARIVPTLGMLAARQTPLGKTAWGRRRNERYLAQPHAERGHASVEWAIGAALAFRRADFDEIGGWDEDFFLYFEDVDFCTRLRQAGRQVHYLPRVELVHAHHRRSDRRHGSLRESCARRHHVRSSLRFFRKHPQFAVRPQGTGRAIGAAGRRAFDVAVATAMLLTLAPLMALVALAVRLDSKGPVLFRQRRLGRNGREFTMFKFRTMHADGSNRPGVAELRLLVTGAHGGHVLAGRRLYKTVARDRITAAGAVLRRWSLDELPQLINVLRGDMSIVGFRPPIPDEVELYPSWYHGRFATKPGITGLWQVSGRNERTYEEMVRFDLEYATRRSPLLDLAILLRTPWVVLRKRGAV